MTADDDIRGALSTLPVPPAGPRFWDDLHRELLRAAESDTVEPAISSTVELGAWVAPRRHTARVVFAAAAVLALVVVGLVWFTGRSTITPAGPSPALPSFGETQLPPASTDPPQMPRRSNGTITDPHAISLDPWLENAPSWPFAATSSFLIFDTSALPTGWSVDSEQGGTSIPTPGRPPSTSWSAILTSPEGVQYSLSVTQPDGPLTVRDATSTSIVVRGHDGFSDPNRIVWRETDADTAVIMAFDSGDHQVEMLALTGGLSATTVERLPSGELSDTPTYRPSDSLLQLRGTIAGRDWWVQITTAPPISTSMSVDGWNQGGGYSSADPTQTTVTDLQLSLNGVPGGVIIYGDAPPALASVQVELSDDVTIDLPVYTWSGGSAFAVPLADGLDAVALAYLDASGNVLHRTLLPEFAIPTIGGTSATSAFGDPAGTNIVGGHAPYRYADDPAASATTAATTDDTSGETVVEGTATQGTSPPPPVSADELRQHPDVLPVVAAGEPCPVTTDFESLSADLGPMAGTGATRPVGIPSGTPLVVGTGGTGKASIVWALPINLESPVLVRGRRLDGDGTIRFALAAGAPGDDLVLSAAAAAEASSNGTADQLDGGWYGIPSTLTFSGSGCFGVQIDSSAGSSVVVFEATLG